jgi:hypothetical protein
MNGCNMTTLMKFAVRQASRLSTNSVLLKQVTRVVNGLDLFLWLQGGIAGVNKKMVNVMLIVRYI